MIRIITTLLHTVVPGGVWMDRLRDGLYEVVAFIAEVHDGLWIYNLGTNSPYTDKELHFIVLGVFGLLIFLLCYLLFRLLEKWHRVGFMAWLLALAIVVLICFAIEIGQQVTNTGGMELADIVYGIVGFLAVSCVVEVIVLLVRLIKWLLHKI